MGVKVSKKEMKDFEKMAGVTKDDEKVKILPWLYFGGISSIAAFSNKGEAKLKVP